MASNDMRTAPVSDPRQALEAGRGERAVLAHYLDHQRMTLELKCEGLTAEQLADRSVPPSTMSLLGLVRHLARVEHSWWRRVLEGHGGVARLYRTDADPDLDFNGAVADEDVVADAWQSWHREVDHARCVASPAARPDLSPAGPCVRVRRRPSPPGRGRRSVPAWRHTPPVARMPGRGAAPLLRSCPGRRA